MHRKNTLEKFHFEFQIFHFKYYVSFKGTVASLRFGNGNGNLSAVDKLRMHVVIPFSTQTF